MTDTDRIQITGASMRDVVAIFREAGVSIHAASLPQLAKLLDLIGDDGDLIEAHHERSGATPRGFGIVVPKTYYNINIKRSALVLCAAILDAVATAGLASALVSLMGLSRQTIAKVDTRSGEYCCLIHLTKLRTAGSRLDPQTLVDLLAGDTCPFVPLQCVLMVDERCGAGVRAMEILFESLEAKGILRRFGGRWSMDS